jgi:flavin-dependent dehydrogenase
MFTALSRRKWVRVCESRARVRVEGAARTECGWRIDISASAPIEARFIVDATGRTASIARHFGAAPVSLDPLMGFSRFFSAGEDSDPRTLIEAVADGWWYTAALTGNRRVATFMTDPDIARQFRLDRESTWREALEQTRFIRRAVPAQPSCREMVRPAGSSYLEEPAGDGWIAAGDAACAHDPLSGQGITRSLRSGILASYAISDFLRNGSTSGLKRYRKLIQHGWSGYLAARRRYYFQEQRWPERSFWRRRHSQDLAEPASLSASAL